MCCKFHGIVHFSNCFICLVLCLCSQNVNVTDIEAYFAEAIDKICLEHNTQFHESLISYYRVLKVAAMELFSKMI